MGATLEETRAVYLTLPEEGSKRHPPRSARLAQIDNGWYESAGTSNSTLEPEPPQDKLVEPPEVPPTPTPITGNITINSVPNGAMVYINNRYIGNTPLQNHILEAGSYSLKLTKTEYENLDGEFRIRVGQNIEREYTLNAIAPSDPVAPLSPPTPNTSESKIPVPQVQTSFIPPAPNNNESKISTPQVRVSVANGTKPISHNSDWTPVERDFNNTTMVLVPAGSFKMGSENGRNDESPAHTQIFANPFWIDKTEVTRGAYDKCVSDGACEFISNNSLSKNANQPINFVNWYKATAYCKWQGMRLPTEREWEYAARGPSGFTYPWGNEFDENKLHYYQNPGSKTIPVGNYPSGASWVGALDMAGNVHEWTSSLYKDYPYRAYSYLIYDQESTKSYDVKLKGNEKNVTELISLRGDNELNGSSSRKFADATFGGGNYGFRLCSFRLTYNPLELTLTTLSQSKRIIT